MPTSIVFAILLVAIGSVACLAEITATSTDHTTMTNGNTATSPAETALPNGYHYEESISRTQLDENGNFA